MDFLEFKGFSYGRDHTVFYQLWKMFQTVLDKWVSISMLQARG